jgi:DNA-binding MarR family transcriptional regulator
VIITFEREWMVFDKEPITRLFGLAAGLHIKSRRIAERELKAAGLTYAQFGVLNAVFEKDGSTQREIATHLETDANTVMVVCDSLEKKGFVERRPDSADRRVWRISLTETGARGHKKALKIVEGLYKPLIELVPREQVDSALPALERLYALVKEREGI